MRVTMARRVRRAFALVLAFASSLSLSVRAIRAETTQCTAITALPMTISLPGVYCLTSDLNVNLPSLGTAITIAANSVVLDLNGHRIANLAGPSTTAVGILAFDRQNVTIKNGSVRGFFTGVLMDAANTSGHVVEDLRVYQSSLVGIAVTGRGGIVRRNQVIATGPGSSPFADVGNGIRVNGSVRVIDNDVISVQGSSGAVGYGIAFLGGDGMAINNRITEAVNGIVMGDDRVKYRDNLTTSVTVPYTGGTDAGNNH
jgi:hypothetical protein